MDKTGWINGGVEMASDGFGCGEVIDGLIGTGVEDMSNGFGEGLTRGEVVGGF